MHSVTSQHPVAVHSLPLGRYAAKLLFQFRVVSETRPVKRRMCEERIVILSAADGRAALREAKKKGRAAQFRYQNNDGRPVRFEFVGVMNLLHLDEDRDCDEVWFDIRERILPMERRAAILPPESKLSAIRNGQ